MRLLLLLTIFNTSLLHASAPNNQAPDDNDVLVLSLLIQDHLRKTNGREINLEELQRADTLGRIAKHFDKIELESKGGYIAVYFRFSETRTSGNIDLLESEKERTKFLKWQERKVKTPYDGEIRIDYGERFYRIAKLIRNKRVSS